MSTAREEWAKVERLLDGALDLEPSDREAYLLEACAGDDALRARVQTLLRSADAAEWFLERPAQDVASDLVREMVEAAADPERPPPFERVGPYRLIRELGRGGMGAVYLAERNDAEFTREVAIKIVQPAAAPDLTARFLAERQILATLDHPNIARLYDGGTSEEGIPYLVMERIDGVRIDAYCDENRLSVPQRIALFETVCDAVQFAHQNMVVHRDLKPSNVLVTPDGTVKLLDFGVAKLLGAEYASRDLTRTGLVPMTPAYASPEQLRGEAISTASDVYALGVLLYELLSGHAPYDVSGRSPSEIERVVVDVTPTRPSATVERAEDPGGTTAAARATTTPALARRLRGDLDNIVLTALRKEPQHRYGSVHQLRDDLRRHRQGLPVSARAPTVRYLAGKFVRRNGLAVGAAALVLLSLVGGLGATAWQARATAREARRATEVRDFLVGLFESVDPDSTRGRTVTALEVLDRGSARLDSGLTAEPALRADMLGVVGRIYLDLGQHDRARPLLEEALRIREESRGTSERDLADSSGDLASVLYDDGDFEAAETLARRAVDLRRLDAREDPERLASALSDLGGMIGRRGDLESADTLYAESIAISRASGNRGGMAAHLSGYGTTLWRGGRNAEARATLEEALAVQREIFGDEHTFVATTLLNLSAVAIDDGEYGRAEELLEECIAIRRKLLGDAHPNVALALSNLGDMLVRSGRLDEAEVAHEQALATYRAAFGDDHPSVAGSLNNLGTLLYYQGRYADAAETFERVLPIWREAYGPYHANVFTVMNNLGASRRAAGELDAAEEVLRETLVLRREAFGDDHTDVAQSLNNLALLLDARGARSEAEPMMREALAIWRRNLGNAHPTVAEGLVGLGRFLLDQSRAEEAEPLLREGAEIRHAVLAPDAPLLASSRVYYAEVLLRLGRLEGIDTLLATATPVLEERWAPDEPIVLRAHRVASELATARRR